MSSHQIEAMERKIAEVYSGISNPTDPPNLCCTFEAQSASGAAVWVQVLAGSVNAQYPLDADPLECLHDRAVRAPQGLELIDWEPNAYATFGVEGVSTRDQAFFVDRWFTRVLDCDEAGYEPRATIEEVET